ncbi:hypothetical protein BCU24_21095 [Vibrio cyclitrophicus]|uniref:glycosyltransferase n=1 Tax=Vibrio cyclitrophicus TaxID=47951 RepID=UPI000C85E833|nr:glycosyltransferase [Vibrio cyclitrophicus]PMJ21411.1 hypothetical protein BCU28_10485 [Vibrio cyclitrophicus]PMJ38243.1 hypothetical protein BCU24_21095 [Vibrio cyclitrophicus]
MLNIAIISSQYPSKNNHYAHTFVHQRSLYFQNLGYKITVLVPSIIADEYTFDGVTVELTSAKNIAQKLTSFDCIYLHLLHIKKPRDEVSGEVIYNSIIGNNIPVAMYIHGAEVQKVLSRKFEMSYSLKSLITMMYKDFYYIPKVAKFYKRLMLAGNYCIATPSLWMKNEAESNLGVELKNVNIIPNGIDTNKFKPLHTEKYNKRLLSIRQLTSSKYAVDLSIQMMVFLPEYILDLYGKGPKLDEYKKMAKNLGVIERINFIEELIPNSEMPFVMNKYKYFVCPTRMDAQGVSMCEAMACGCIVITNSNTAIPEFVNNGKNGICSDTPEEMAKKISELNNNIELSSIISCEARNSMLKLDINVMLNKELNMLKLLVDKKLVDA